MISKQEQKIINECNIRLLELGSIENVALYEWTHSDDIRLQMPFIYLDDDLQPVREYICICGINKSIHKPECKFTAVRNKAELKSTVPFLTNQWVLTRWQAPPTESQWTDQFGDQFPYPRNGYRTSVGDQVKTIALKPGKIPSLDITDRIIHAIKNQPSVRELDRQFLEQEKKREEKAALKFKEAVKAVATVGDDYPGKNANVSFLNSIANKEGFEKWQVSLK